MNSRNHYRYELKQGYNVVYFGITKNPEFREMQHAHDGKRFSKMNVVGPVVTKETAERWEELRLAGYRRSHGGKNPLYNKTQK